MIDSAIKSILRRRFSDRYIKEILYKCESNMGNNQLEHDENTKGNIYDSLEYKKTYEEIDININDVDIENTDDIEDTYDVDIDDIENIDDNKASYYNTNPKDSKYTYNKNMKLSDIINLYKNFNKEVDKSINDSSYTYNKETKKIKKVNSHINNLSSTLVCILLNNFSLFYRHKSIKLILNKKSLDDEYAELYFIFCSVENTKTSVKNKLIKYELTNNDIELVKVFKPIVHQSFKTINISEIIYEFVNKKKNEGHRINFIYDTVRQKLNIQKDFIYELVSFLETRLTYNETILIPKENTTYLTVNKELKDIYFNILNSFTCELFNKILNNEDVNKNEIKEILKNQEKK